MRSLLTGTVRAFRSQWNTLLLADFAFKLIAFIVLTPLVGVLFRVLIALSGRAVMSDLDILFYFLGPVGWCCAIVAGGAWLGIVAIEQTSLLGLLAAKQADCQVGVLGALQYGAKQAWPVIRLTTRLVAYAVFVAVPFLAAAGVTYWALLTGYDVNYYLEHKPPVFAVAVGIGIALLLGLVALLLRLVTSWFFALPLLLFENASPSDALRQSANRAQGHRRTLLVAIIAWSIAFFVLSALATAIVGLLGRFVVSASTASLYLLAASVGVTILLLAVANLAINLLGTATFSCLLWNAYLQFGGGGNPDFAALGEQKQPAVVGGIRLTRGRLIVGALVGFIVAVAVGVATLRGLRLRDDVQIMAHRGASYSAPENTMASIRQAIKDGAAWVEIDVQETADGEVVVFHDSDFMKLSGVDLKIWDTTTDDLQDLDVGSWFSPEFQGERVPTLAEVLDECRGRIGVNIELKYYGHNERLEQRVAEIVDSRDMASQVMAMSLKMDALTKMKRIRPNWKVGLLMSVHAGKLSNIDADFLAVNAAFADRRLIENAHEDGRDVYVWTVNDAPTMSIMMSRGVDGLLTDRPALARNVLQQRAEMSTPERLLLELAGLFGVSPKIGEP
jgi:glycerophosphoryl diester phosphodiesterase